MRFKSRYHYAMDTPMKNVAVIGAGAAGLMAAVTAAERCRVTLFEQNDEAGRKILASGNGRCNIINTHADLRDYDGEDPAFVTHALAQLDFRTFERFCRDIGLLLDVTEDGRCYPLSHEARAVQSVLVRYARKKGVILRTGTPIHAIERTPEGLRVTTATATEPFDAVLIATGSPAAPQLGGTDAGLRMVEALGHRIVTPYPSLVQLHLDHPALQRMQGVKTSARVTLLLDRQQEAVQDGDVLFTRYGISGFAILDLSQQASRALVEQRQVALDLDLLPIHPAQHLTATLGKMAEALPERSTAELLEGLLPRKLIVPILDGAGIAADLPAAELSTRTLKRLVHRIKQWRVPVVETHGFRHAEVAGGGVATEEIDPTTMGSRKVPGLYFAGEVIDIVGRRGGFNFHFAWASGALAARSMAGLSGSRKRR